MKKWTSWLAVTALSLGLAGCSPAADNARDTTYNNGAGVNANGKQTARSLTDHNNNINNQRTPFANANMNDQSAGHPGSFSANSMYQDGDRVRITAQNRQGRNYYGYAVYAKQDMNTQQANTFYVDRNVLARAIGTVVTSIPGVDRSTVLVTDDQIFVGMPGVTDVSTLNKAKLSAWSVSPRYYQVYVSGDEKTIGRVNQLVNKANNRRGLDEAKLNSILKNETIDMTGTNATDNGQNKTDHNLNRTFPNTGGNTSANTGGNTSGNQR